MRKREFLAGMGLAAGAWRLCRRWRGQDYLHGKNLGAAPPQKRARMSPIAK